MFNFNKKIETPTSRPEKKNTSVELIKKYVLRTGILITSLTSAMSADAQQTKEKKGLDIPPNQISQEYKLGEHASDTAYYYILDEKYNDYFHLIHDHPQLADTLIFKANFGVLPPLHPRRLYPIDDEEGNDVDKNK